MARHIGCTFKGVRVILDGEEFVNCVFKDCELVFRGAAMPKLHGCEFDHCGFTLDGPSAMTLAFMRHILVSGGKDVFEGWFPELFEKTLH